MSAASHKHAPKALPSGWRWAQLRDVVDVASGQVDPKEPRYRKLPHVNGENIVSGTGRLLPVRSAADDHMTSGKYLFAPGVVLYSKLRPYLKKAALVGFSGLCSADMYPLTPKFDKLTPHFLLLTLLSEPFTTYAISESQRARMPKLNRDQLLAYQIPLPPLPEQRRIAAILKEQLAAVDKARAAAEARLEAALALPTAIAHEPLRNSTKQRRMLGDCLIEVKKGVGAEWAKYPVLGATRGGLAPAKEGVGKAPERYKLVDPVTVFYNPMRILLGSIAMVDEGDASGITSPDYVVVKGREGILDTRWFYYWFRSTSGANLITSLSRGAVRERMLFNRLAAGEIEIPDYAIQLRASERMAMVRPLIEGVTQELAAINAIPAALLRRAFTGEL